MSDYTISLPVVTTLVSILTTAYTLQQNKKHHNEGVILHETQHKREIETMEDQHIKEMLATKQAFLLNRYVDIEQHFQQLNADLVVISKESERDMFDQRQQEMQTMVIAATVMLSNLITVLIQGTLSNLPDSASLNSTTVLLLNQPALTIDYVVDAYSIANAGSLAFLVVSIVLSVEIMIRSSSFMYRNSEDYMRQVKDSMNITKDLMRAVRNLQVRMIDDHINITLLYLRFQNLHGPAARRRSPCGTP